MDERNYKTDNAILALLLEQQEIEAVKQEVGLVPNESGYETHAGKFFTTDDFITLRDKKTGALDPAHYTGLLATNYNILQLISHLQSQQSRLTNHRFYPKIL